MLSRLLLAAAARTPRRLHPVLRRIPGANRVRPAEYADVTVHHGALDGAKFRLNLATERALWLGDWEPEVQESLARLAQPHMVCWDVGAHIGFFTVLLGRRCQRVVAVEAHPVNADRTRANCVLNGIDATVVAAAVWDQPGQLALRLGPDTGVHKAAAVGGRSWGEELGELTVPATTLDLLADEYGLPDLLKLDVERAEVRALSAAGQVLGHAKVVLVETHSDELRQEVDTMLQAHGFSIDALDATHLVGTR